MGYSHVASSVDQRTRVVVISPLRERTWEGKKYTQSDNMARAFRLAGQLCAAGFAPFAPHGFYTHFLDDTKPEDRRAGMEAGGAWLAVAQAGLIDATLGVSGGMAGEIELCSKLGVPLVFCDDALPIATIAGRLRKVARP